MQVFALLLICRFADLLQPIRKLQQLHPDLRQRTGAEPVVSVDVIQAEALLGQLVVGSDEAGLRIDEAILQHVIEQRQRARLDALVAQVMSPAPEQVRSADRVGRPARPLQITEIVPVHDLAVGLDEAGFRAQVAVERFEAAQREMHRRAGAGEQDGFE